jgi:hypothetical protein
LKKTLFAMALAAGLASAAHAAPVQWTVGSGGNDHWYEFVPTVVTWSQARAAALASTFSGMQGYLVTATSAGENRFASNLAGGGQTGAWIGLSDDQVEGDFRWMDGPEAGQSAVFTSWAPSEPNDCCAGEDYVVTNWGGLGLWNDIGLPSFPNYAVGYLVEYNDPTHVPEPMTLSLVLPALLAAAGVSRRRRNA